MLGRRYSPSFLQGTRPRFASDTLMSLRAIPSFSLGYLVLRQRIYAPLRVSVFGVRCGFAGVAVDVWWFSMCAPCLANWCGGGLSRFSLLPGGWVFCVQAHESPPPSYNSSGQSFQKVIKLQDRPNPRHKLAEVLHILTLLQQARAVAGHHLRIILEGQLERATVH